MRPYTYLLVNFFTIIICLIFSFHPKIRFYRYFGPFLKASMLVALPFLAWDVWFTNEGIWWFNYNYLIGASFAGLPLEEILFFICIPFSCLFTYYCINSFFNLDWVFVYNKFIVYLILLISLGTLLFYYDRYYPALTAIALAIGIIFLHYVVKFKEIGKVTLIYIILIPGFISVNGVLTGTGLDSPVVNYNSDEIIGLRFLTIPVEDFFYGYLLILLNVFAYGQFSRITLATK